MQQNRASLTVVIILALLVSLPIPAGAAGVNIKTGSYCASFADVEPSNFSDLKLERFYSPHRPDRGMFGWHWTAFDETYLRPKRKGLVSLKLCAECPGIDFREVKGNSRVFRPAHHRYYSLRQTAAGYELRGPNLLLIGFDMKGRMINKKRGALSLTYAYSEEGRLTRISDRSQRDIKFTYNSRGLVATLEDSLGSKVTYGYDEADNLVSVKNHKEDLFEYEYDGRHNLTEVTYPNGTRDVISYYKDSDKVEVFIRPDGEFIAYDYEDVKIGRNTRKAIVRELYVPNTYGDIETIYTLTWKKDRSGHEYLSERITARGERQEHVYYDSTGNTRKIVADGKVTAIRYNRRDLPIMKRDSHGEVTTIKYHPRWAQAIRIIQAHPREKWSRTTILKYDSAGRVMSVDVDGEYKGIISYDETGRVSGIASGPEKLSFRYDSQNRAAEFILDGAGKLNVSYDESGRLSTVEAEGSEDVKPRIIEHLTASTTALRQANLPDEIARPGEVPFSRRAGR